VLRIEQGRDDAHYLRVLRSRISDVPPEPVEFEIVPDGGLKTRPAVPHLAAGIERVPTRSPRRLLVLHTSDNPSAEIVDLLDRDYETVIRPAPAPEQALDLTTTDIDGIVLSVSHDTVGSALSLLCRLNEQPDMVPVVVAARFNLRSLDRAHALRAGADEILATDMSAPEFLQRLAGTLSRPHLPPSSISPPYSDALIFQPRRGFTHKPLTREEFASALASHVSQDNPIQYTVVTFALGDEGANGMSPYVPLSRLSDVVMRASRMRSGDLTAVIDDCVAVYLHGAQQDQAEAFADRVQKVWAGRRHAPLRIESFPYPSGEPQLRTMFEVSAS
jgi:CheY-like chemotaxis protein